MHRNRIASTAILFVLFILAAVAAPKIQAANIVVNTNSDNPVSRDGKCTLREAINNANADKDTSGGDCVAGSGADTITFSFNGTITVNSILPTLKTNITIDGTGHTVTLDGDGNYQILRANGTLNTVNLTALTLSNAVCNPNPGGGGALTNFVTTNITNVTFSSNDASSCLGGGAIHNGGGTLKISNSKFSKNSANSVSGGAILSTGSVKIVNSTFSQNSGRNGSAIYNVLGGKMTVNGSTFKNNGGADYGAAIYNNGSTLNVNGSTFTGNDTQVSGYGGGIANMNGTVNIKTSTFAHNWAKRGGGVYNESGTMNIVASTISENKGWGSGGGLSNSNGAITLINSTVYKNDTGGQFGGAISSEGGALNITNSTLYYNHCICVLGGASGIDSDNTVVTLSNTIIAGAPSLEFAGEDCDDYSSIHADGHNFATSPSCGQATVVTFEQLDLRGLDSYGGPTQTVKLGPNSIALDKGYDLVCADAVSNNGAGGVDQRGVTRPQGPHCDPGAFERQIKTSP